MLFQTVDGIVVPAVTAAQMREVDRLAMEEFGLGILQMMENAGRSLAENVMDVLDQTSGRVAILTGAGGNGGGGLCCARHLHNRGLVVDVVLDREARALHPAAKSQLDILQATGLQPKGRFEMEEAIRRADLIVDALIGYSLHGAPRGRAAGLIELCNQHASRVLALDVPSGRDATTGETPGLVIRADRTLTLALPKTGLAGLPGELYLADIGIPPEVYGRLGLFYESPFDREYWIYLEEDKE